MTIWKLARGWRVCYLVVQEEEEEAEEEASAEDQEGFSCQGYNVACNCGTTYEVAAGRSAPENAPAKGDMVRCFSCDCW